MQLLDHVSIDVHDFQTARPFYDAIMAALGAAKVYDRPSALGYGSRCSASDTTSTCLAVYLGSEKVAENRRHWCFKAPSRSHVDAFFAAGLAFGGLSGGEPGLRPSYHPDYYAAFLIDPEGEITDKFCTLCQKSKSFVPRLRPLLMPSRGSPTNESGNCMTRPPEFGCLSRRFALSFRSLLPLKSRQVSSRGGENCPF